MEKEKLNKKKEDSTLIKSAWEALTSIGSALIALLASSLSIFDFVNVKGSYSYIILLILILPIFSIYILKTLNKEPSKKTKLRLSILKAYEKALNASKFNPIKE